jgi:hypothetical protein
MKAAAVDRLGVGSGRQDGGWRGGASPREPAAPKPDLSKVAARKNLNETAFFFPQLTSDSNGVVRMTFTMPEALTKWRFLGFAHDQSVRAASWKGTPSRPRTSWCSPIRRASCARATRGVHRQGVQPERQAQTRQGAAHLQRQALTEQPAGGQAAGQHQAGAGLRHPGEGIAQLRLAHHVPDGCGFLTYKAVGRGRPTVSTARKAICRCCPAAFW